MYTFKDKIYADAGKYLKCRNSIGFQFSSDWEVTEHDLMIDDMFVSDDVLKYNNRLFAQKVLDSNDYSSYKTAFIHKLFDNDSQIAIILNKDDSEEDTMIYNKMQEWREYSGVIANKMVEVLKQNKGGEHEIGVEEIS